MRRFRPVAASLALGLVAPVALAEFATVGGHEVWYEVRGDLGSGRTPVLVLHGGMMSTQTTFGALIPVLAEARPVIGIDQQGHGRTADRDGPLTLAGMMADTLGVLDTLGVERVHVVGFSLGGMLGLELAVRAPERVASLAAISASASIDGMLPEIRAMNTDPNFRPSPEVAALMPTEADFAAMAAGFADNPSGPEIWQTTLVKAGQLMTSGWGWSAAELGTVEAPVLLAVGDRDFVLPAHAVWMAEAVPGAHLAMLPDTTHTTIMLRPELVPMIAAHLDAAE